MKTHTIRATAEQAAVMAQISSGVAVLLSSGVVAQGGRVVTFECSKSHGGSIAAHRSISFGTSRAEGGDGLTTTYQLFRVWPNGQTDRI